MKYRPDLESFLRESKPNDFAVASKNSIKNSRLGKLVYHKELVLDLPINTDKENGETCKTTTTESKVLNSFELSKHYEDDELMVMKKLEISDKLVVSVKDEKNELLKREDTQSSLLLDELTVTKTKFNVDAYLKELNENDNKELAQKHKKHVQMFEKFRTSPLKREITSMVISEKSVDKDLDKKTQQNQPQQQQEPVQEAKVEKEKQLTPDEIANKLNEPLARELFDYEKKVFDLMDRFNLQLSKINDIGKEILESGDDTFKNLIKLCQNRIAERQTSNNIADKLKLLLRVSPNTYEQEIRSFMDQFKRRETSYKNELAAIEVRINDRLQAIENEKIEKKKKAIESFVKETSEMQIKFQNLMNVFKRITDTIESIDSKHEKFDEMFYKLLPVKINELDKLANVQLKEIMDNRARLEQFNEDNFKDFGLNFKKLYVDFVNTIKAYETKLNDEMRKMASNAPAVVTPAVQPPPPPTTTATTVTPATTTTTATTTTSNASAAQLETPSSSVTSQNDFMKLNVMKQSLENYKRLTDKLKALQNELNIFNTPQLKPYKYELQNAINFPLNSLLEDSEDSEENKRNFFDKIKTISRLLSGQTCIITSTLTVNPTKHPKAIEFCMDYLAKKIVEKGEKSVSSRPETAFQYSQLAITVIKQFPLFEDILIAYFYEKCPYLIPHYRSKSPTQTIEDYFQSLGYKVEDGKVEEEEYYFKRMTGIFYLYFTLLINKEFKNGIKIAWQWLSDVLNMKPRANITAHMLAIFFKCCGYQLHKVYLYQFEKIIKLFINQYVKYLKSINAESQNIAYLGRLELIFEDYKKAGRFNEWKK